ncbi:MAG: radical SAM family heme chaperone HemW [Lachnospiraceae bacterium]|nr:radical SAM family heme chaperone HemW [Lachnospiraceae bacterium]
MTKKPISLYIHIPYCIRKCLYCDFLSFPIGEKLRSTGECGGKCNEKCSIEVKNYVDSLCKEIKIWGDYLCKSHYVSTIFIGGGTPSVLDKDSLLKIENAVFEAFNVEEDLEFFKSLNRDSRQALNQALEFSMEVNPGTVDDDFYEYLKASHVNRISIGLQSTEDSELKALGRIHNYEEFLQTYELIKKAGIDNINIDLMQALPNQTYESYVKTLDKVLSIEPGHISAYSLIIEEETPFYELNEMGRLNLPSEDMEREMYHITKLILKDKGYDRYEISNYAKEGFECKHNLTYWSGGDYLGLGLGAASKLQNIRFSNERDISEYMLKVEKLDGLMQLDSTSKSDDSKHLEGLDIIKYYQDIEKLDTKAQMEEFFFLGLRKTKGVSLKDFKEAFKMDPREIYGDVIDKYIENRILEFDESGKMLRFTDYGTDVSNVCLSEFLL